MRSDFEITPGRGAGLFAAALSVLALVLSSATPVRAQGTNASADADFLTKAVPGIAASVKIIDYEVKSTSDATVREFAQRVLKQHTESVKTATGHARRLKIAVDTSGDKDSREMLDKHSAPKGSERDARQRSRHSNRLGEAACVRRSEAPPPPPPDAAPGAVRTRVRRAVSGSDRGR